MFKNFMPNAIEEAKKAFFLGELPVGAVVISPEAKIIAAGHNNTISGQNILLHAEIIALNTAMQLTGAKRLDGFSMYVTMEPCPMCAFAISLCQIKNLFFGCKSPNGGCGSLTNVISPRINICDGIMEEECGLLLKQFFKLKRNVERPT